MITRAIYVNLIRSPRRETGAAGNPNSGTDRGRLADFVKGPTGAAHAIDHL